MTSPADPPALAAEALPLLVAPFEALLRPSAAAALLCDPAGLIRAVNPAAQRLLGYAEAELLGRRVESLHSEAELLTRSAPLQAQRATGVMLWSLLAAKADAPDLQEWQLQRKDGKTLPLQLTVAELRDAQGHTAGYLGLGWDLSERGRFDQLKSEFISTVSHELRTPLTAITGALGLLRGGACGDLGEAAQPMLEIAHKNSLRLGHLINDLLDMERLASDRLRLDLHVQALMPLVDKAIELAQGFAREHQVEFRLSARADGAEVRVDAERLRQVMVHFLSNAAKFSPRGSQVELRVSCADGAARVEVIDHGCGIPEHFRGRIFQKFSQADSSDTRQKGGTGLGLAICKGLIERMNGLIGFESTPGVGTRFHFQLPLMRQAARAAPFGGLSLPGAPLVLVVEDEPDIAQLIVLMLNRAGLGAEVAGTALEAVERLQEGGVAAMTLDLLLPDQSGLALMQHIRELPGFRQLPVVVVSAFIEDGRHSLSRELEPIDWIPKPIDEGRLIQALRTGLERLANKSQP